jgi:hypothetical protein
MRVSASVDTFVSREVHPDGADRAVWWSVPQRFGYKCGWIAVRGTIGAAEGTPIEWDAGVRGGCSGELVFTVPIRGWTVTLSAELLDREAAALEAHVVELSRQHGEALAFLSDRVADHYGWIRAGHGAVVRSYIELADRVLRDEGLPLACEPRSARAVDEGDVLEAAKIWAFDPTALADDEVGPGFATPAQGRAVTVMELGGVASRKEARLHARSLVARGCPRCLAADPVLVETVYADGHEATLTCADCHARFRLVYMASAGWSDQPAESEPRITSLAAPSALLPPAFLVHRAEHAAERAVGGDSAAAWALVALESLDELEKHRDFAIPDRIAFDTLKAALLERLRGA